MSSFPKFNFLLILIIPLILVSIWFRTGLVEGGGEEGLAFYNPTKTSYLSKNMWWDYNGGFPTLACLSKVTTTVPSALLYEKLHIPNYLLQALTYFILLAVGAGSVYFLNLDLLKDYKKAKAVALVSAIFYILNPYSMSQIWGRGLAAQFFGFALLPLGLLLFLRGLNGRFIYLLYFVLSSVLLSSAFGISTFVITFWVVVSVSFLVWLLLNRLNLRKVIYGLSFYFLAIFLWILANLWWLLPTLISGGVIYSGSGNLNFEENIGTLLGVSHNYTPWVLIRLLQRTYFYDPSAFSPLYSTFLFEAISILFPIFLILGLFRILRNRQLAQFRILLAVFLVGLIVSLGANPPFGRLFVWIFKKISILQAFRNPFEKFGLVYALGYSAVFAIGLVSFFENKRFKNLGIFIVLVLTCGIFAWPMWTGLVLSSSYRSLGVDVPIYYKDLDKWLNQNSADNRVFMVPLWSGDGSFYSWNNSKYIGLDPTIYITDTPTVSSMPKFSYFYDFISNIRKYVNRKDIADSLRLFRVKYIVNRDDAINVSEAEKGHIKNLTEFIYVPSNTSDLKQVVCQNLEAVSQSTSSSAWIQCPFTKEVLDISQAKFLRVSIKVDQDSNLDLAIRDVNQMRPRWYGTDTENYFLQANKTNEVLIPLSAPTEVNNNTDLSKIVLIEVQVHPIGSPSGTVGKIELFGIWLDPGIQQKVNNFKLVKKFGKLTVFEPNDFVVVPPEYGVLNFLHKITNFEQMFDQVVQKKDALDKEGFVVTAQNKDKSMDHISIPAQTKVLESQNMGGNKFWLKTDKADYSAYIILSQNYNSEWKVIPGATRADLENNFLSRLKLLKKVYIEEKDHFVVNGYANLWKVQGSEDQYAIVFRPQLIADIGADISKLFFVLFLLTISVNLFIVWKKRSTYSR